MADDTKNHKDRAKSSSGLAATAGSAAAAFDVEETNVDILVS
jgi:hypothetical protein